MTKVNKGTRNAQAMVRDLEYRRENRDIYDAYDRPSRTKVDTFNAIKRRALETEGYNYDLHVCGHNTSTYSTVYSFTQNGKTYIVKDTKSNTFITEL